MASAGDVFSTIGAISAGTAAIAAEAQKDAEQAAVDKWLATADLPGGQAIHIVTGLTVQALSTLNMPLVSTPGNTNLATSRTLSETFNMSPAAAETLQRIYGLTQQPNIEGIVIVTTKEHEAGSNDISLNTVIVQQQDGATQKYVCDNAVVKPQEWQLTGFLTTILPTDHYLVIKPSIIQQRTYLDMCRKSRRPVWFKTYDNRFFQALITDISTDYDPQYMNGLPITIKLVEYTPLEVNTLQASVDAAIRAMALR